MLIGFSIYLQNVNKIEAEQTQEDSFNAYVQYSEKKLSEIFSTVASIKTLATFDEFALSSNVDYYSKITQLYKDLNKFERLFSINSYNVFIHKLNDDTTITTSGTKTLNTILNELNISNESYQNALDVATKNRPHLESYIVTDYYLVYISQKDYMDKRIVVSVQIPHDNLSATVYSNNDVFEESYYDANVIDLRQETKKIDIEPEIININVSDDLAKINHEGNIIYLASSRYIDMNYIYLPTDSYNYFSFDFILFMTAITILVCLTSFVIIKIMSTKIYKPIERLMHIFLDANEDMNAKKNIVCDEISYIASGISTIRKDNQALTNQLENVTLSLKTKFIYDLCNGNLNKNEIYEGINNYRLGWIESKCSIISFDILQFEMNELIYFSKIFEDVAAFLKEQLSYKYNIARVFATHSSIDFIIGYDDFKQLKDDMVNFAIMLDTGFNITSNVYIGSQSNAPEELSGSMEIVKKIKSNQNMLPVKNVYTSEDYIANNDKNTIFTLDLESRITIAVEQCNNKEVNKLLNMLFDENLEEIIIDKYKKEIYTCSIINMLIRILQKMNLPVDDFNFKAMHSQLSNCDSVECLKENIKVYVNNVLEQVRVRGSKNIDELKLSLEKYIDENYMKDISLLDVSEFFEFSPTYMSVLFKNTLGVNFKEYLSKVRFNHAVEILKTNSDIKLADLSEMVGISNVNTFIRIFKNYSDMSPGRYAKKFKKNNIT